MIVSDEVEKITDQITVGNVVATGLAYLTGGVSAAVITGASSVALGYYTASETKKRRKSQQQALNDARSRFVAGRTSREARVINYGQGPTSGSIVFEDATDGQVIRVIVVASHEIQSFDSFWIDEEYVPLNGDPTIQNVTAPAGHRYQYQIDIRAYLGKPGQGPDLSLMQAFPDKWDLFSKLTGCAYYIFSQRRNTQVFPNGEAESFAIVKGKKCIDIRSTNTNRVWTDNPSLIAYDYWTDVFGFLPTEMNTMSYIAGANANDVMAGVLQDQHLASTVNPRAKFEFSRRGSNEISLGSNVVTGDRVVLSALQIDSRGTLTHVIGVNQVRGVAWTDGTGFFKVAASIDDARNGVFLPINGLINTGQKSHEKTYTLNNIFSTERQPDEIMSTMLLAQNADDVWSGGQMHLLPDIMKTSSGTLTENEILYFNSYSPVIPRNLRANSIKGFFIDPNLNWQPTDLPTATEDTFRQRDGETLYKELPLDSTITQNMAQRVAYSYLYNLRNEHSMSISTHLSQMKYEVGDVITIDHEEMVGPTPKDFEIVDFNIVTETATGDNEVLVYCVMTIQETQYQFSWSNTLEEVREPIVHTSIPNPIDDVETPNNVQLFSGNDYLAPNTSGNIVSGLHVTWDITNDVFSDEYEIQWKKSVDTQYQTIRVGRTPRAYTIYPVEDGVEYDVRVRSLTNIGIHSDFAENNGYLVIGKTEVPPDILGGFTVVTLPSGSRRLNIDTSTWPADVRNGGGAIVKYTTNGLGTWTSSDTLTLSERITTFPYETLDVAAGQTAFGIKMLDSSGNESVNPLWITVTLGPQNLGETFFNESEGDSGFDGSLGSTTFKGYQYANGPRLLLGNPTQTLPNLPANTTWTNRPDGGWDNAVYSTNQVEYTTRVKDLGSSTNFFAVVDLDISGTAATSNFIYGETVNASGAIVSPTTVAFTAGSATAPITARYFQVQTRVNPIAATKVNAAMRNLTISLSGRTVSDIYPDINTLTSTTPGFARLGVGHFTVEHRQGAGLITFVSTDIQGTLSSSNAATTVRVLNKNVANTTRPTAELQLYNSAGNPVEGTVDIELRGPRSG